MASWGCFGAFEDRIFFFLKVQGQNMLIFEGFNEVRGAVRGGWRRSGPPVSGPLSNRKERMDGLDGRKGGR